MICPCEKKEKHLLLILDPLKMAQQYVEGDFVVVEQDLRHLKEFNIVKLWSLKKMVENPLSIEIN